MKNLLLFLSIFVNSSIFSQEPNPTIDLPAEVQNLEEILVSSIRVDKNAPIAFSNVTKDDLAKNNLGQDLPILLNSLTSVVTTSDAGAGVGYTGIRIRGVNAQSTNITINGIPYNDAESLGTFWVDLPDFASSVENLQVQRGVGTSTNGSSAFGASINILTDLISEKSYFETSNSVGSYNTIKNTFKFSTGMLNDYFEFSGRLSKIDSDGYIDRANSDLKSYFLQGTYKKNTTMIKALSFGGHEITYQAWNGIDGATLESDRTYNPSGMYIDQSGNVQFYNNEVDNYKQDHYQLHWSEILNSSFTSNFSFNLTNGLGYYEQYKENDNQDYITRKWLDNQFIVANYSLNYQSEKTSINFGSSYSEYDGDHFGKVIWAQNSSNTEVGDRFYDGNGIKKDFSNYLKTTYQINSNISLYGDIQIRNVKYDTSGSTSDILDFSLNKSYSFFNPKAGLNYAFNSDNNLYFSFARANREPTRSDFENNADIQPEKLNDLELGWNFSKNNFLISTNFYYMQYENQLVLTGSIDDVGNPVRQNSGESHRMGLEIESSFTISNKFSLSANSSFSQNKNKNFVTSLNGELINLGRTNISFSPNLISSINLLYSANKNLDLSLLVKHVGDQYMSNTDSDFSKLDAYSTLDFNLNYNFKNPLFFNEIVLTAVVNNVLGIKYVSNGYYYTYDDTWSNPNSITTIEGAGYYPQATTNYLIGLKFKL
ncbi:MAG: iron complex outermembrane receptor protein [Flavobacteriaceae bacterium]|jgi:iron complex outermembrane receptor protein|tara:strand:+ start:27 stop:2159 length:2133 start_codon:yes stop_codon:yes gene_type:complete